MRFGVAAVLLLVFLTAAGCGGTGPPTKPEDVVRAWSAALNAGDNAKAAKLFAPDAKVIQGGVTLELPDTDAATKWNAGLPCSGQIIETSSEGDEVTAGFELGHRPGHECSSPGAVAYALFQIADGKIVLWDQVPDPHVTSANGETA